MEIRDAVSKGAEEIDIVLSRSHVMQGNWEEVNNNYDMCSLIFIPKAFDGLIISFVVVEI